MQKKDMIYIQKQNYNIWRDIKKKNDFFSSHNNLFVNLKRHKKNGESFIYISSLIWRKTQLYFFPNEYPTGLCQYEPGHSLGKK